MINQILLELFERDLSKLKEELNLYKDERKIWEIKGEIKNCAGNLALHLLGNLNHFIGAILGSTGYLRNRDSEFSDKNIARAELAANIDETIIMIKSVLSKLADADLEKHYPIEVLKSKGKMSTGFFLIHLIGHLNYHLGQVNYHRRLI
jgi:uncharacterized damage-inducible protein DinB